MISVVIFVASSVMRWALVVGRWLLVVIVLWSFGGGSLQNTLALATRPSRCGLRGRCALPFWRLLLCASAGKTDHRSLITTAFARCGLRGRCALPSCAFSAAPPREKLITGSGGDRRSKGGRIVLVLVLVLE